jgi:MYXO-CTERM domain-containing protein
MTNGGAGNAEGGDGGDPGGAGKTNGAAGTGANGTGAGTGTTGTGSQGKYGLVTGGGGCACRTVPTRNGHWAGLASLLALGAVLDRRRRRAARRAA